MDLRWLLAGTHLLALAIGFSAVLIRSQALRRTLDAPGLRRVFIADMWWGIAAVIWLVTGLARVLGGFEKGTIYYMQNQLFWAKMSVFLLVLLLELVPMLGLVRWRIQLARGAAPDTRPALRYARVGDIEAGLILVIVFLATGMARGFGVMR